MYYSPGVKYLCPRCNSDLVRFVFDANCYNWDESMKLIKENKVKIIDSLECATGLPKWICKNCYNCGAVQKA